MHRLDRTQARRIAVRAQLLDAKRPTDLLAVVHQLTLVQIDPTAVIAPNADLVLWSRLGSSYQPSQLQEALELEMYKPKAQRRWGSFALPILHDDRLIGKVDATADRKSGTLVVHAIHQDLPFTPAMTEGIENELSDLASWLRLAGPDQRP